MLPLKEVFVAVVSIWPHQVAAAMLVHCFAVKSSKRLARDVFDPYSLFLYCHTKPTLL